MSSPDGGNERTERGAQQPPAGEPVGRQEPSVTDIATSPLAKDYAKWVAVVFAAAGVGVGLLVALLPEVGSPALVQQGGSPIPPAQQKRAFRANLVSTGVNLVQFLPLFLGPVVGFYAGRDLEEGVRTSAVVAAVATGVGAFLLVVLGGFIAGSQMPGSVSYEIGTGVVNAIVVAVVAGAAGAAGGYAGERL